MKGKGGTGGKSREGKAVAKGVWQRWKGQEGLKVCKVRQQAARKRGTRAQGVEWKTAGAAAASA